ncbi:pyruvate dehydrogenase (acetyl-transferring) E1 component subunit alpha [Leptospira perolatii]|uniref:Pyruvate dehydrogenase E1 component subunit alpha n=1 Tax=Leptospira perolatii TaxID=2023191 RepID=A0A2M9ZJE8_9LEPT|nr:pyruvate dehydrogenase (acetyl-transferring) E1 component subunit alpha [Leptospira perolatii]PJZ68442.1 pyruvate dehydrogenase (acetyl-transferring) E1 component subunit alpha [Leptospira perolatii]PJZ72141.1 pyruvate dehydrogenase (acetyl-transferring) E1 component subunit alpha [Leptospira perolatii]
MNNPKTKNDTKDLYELYHKMLLIRRFEEASAKAYSMGKIGGFCHLYIGQEAVGVGAISALQDKDYVVSTYRDHGHALTRGLDPKALMSELFGKRTGVAKGYGGSMHFFDKEKNFMGGHGIVGGHISLAAGIAYASKYRGDDSVTLCFFGEGAANIGSFHEGMNLAAIWKLPLVMICENNHYAMGTPEYRALSVKDVSVRATAYDIARDHIEGDEVRKVRDHVQVAVDRARRGEGPTLMEISTYRFRGHSMSDPAKYRTKEELERYKQGDPLIRAQRDLNTAGWGIDELEKLDNDIQKTVDEAVVFAEKSEEPPLGWLYKYVYAENA